MQKLENGLPGREPTTACLRDLLGVGITIKKADKPIGTAAFWSTFLGDDDHLSVLCGIDLPLSAYMACGLAAIPKPVAEETIKSKKMEASHAETVREVVNVASSLFNVPGSPHVRLKTFAQQGSKEYDELAAMVAKGRARSDMSVQVERYGSGTMTFVTFEKASS